MDIFFFIKYWKEYFFPPTLTFEIANIFSFPTELINKIFYDTDLFKYRELIWLLRFRLINKKTLLAIDNFFKIQCQNLCLYDEKVNPIKLYFNIIYFNIKLSTDTMIYYNKSIRCAQCNYNKTGFLIKVSDHYECAFQCRKYYCCNRNCEKFSKIIDYFYIEELLLCGKCDKQLSLYKNGTDPKICQQYCDSPKHSKCKILDNTYYGYYLAIFACHECWSNYPPNKHLKYKRQQAMYESSCKSRCKFVCKPSKNTLRCESSSNGKY